MADYRKLITTDSKVQVDSAIRDEDGVRIKTNYQRKPQVIEYTVSSATGNGLRSFAEYNGTYDGSPGYVRFRLEISSSAGEQVYDIEASWGGTRAVATLISGTGSNYNVSLFRIYYPSTTSSYGNGISLCITNTNTVSKTVKITVYETSDDLTWLNNWDSGPSISSRTYYEISFAYLGDIHHAKNASVADSAGETYRLYAYDCAVSGQGLDYESVVAVADDDLVYPINTANKVFPLPIKLGRPRLGTTSAQQVVDFMWMDGTSSYLSTLTDATIQGRAFTLPTFTSTDRNKQLFIRGSIDSNNMFVCDGTITISMDAGYTYIPFGSPISRSYSTPDEYIFNSLNTHAYTIDASGKISHIDGKPVGGSGGSSEVIEYTVPTSVTTGNKVIATYDGTYDGTPGYVRFRMEVTSSANKGIYELLATWGYGGAGISLLSGNAADTDTFSINIYYASASLASTHPPFLSVNNSTTNQKTVKITILDSSEDLVWKEDWNTAAVTSGYNSRTVFCIKYGHVDYAHTAGSASSAMSAEYAESILQLFAIAGETVSARSIVALSTDGKVWKVNNGTSVFPLPIRLYIPNASYGVNTDISCYTYHETSALSDLTDASYQGRAFTLPTITLADANSPMFLRGTLDSNNNFVPDGNITLTMDPGYTYIQFGNIAPHSTSYAPAYFVFDALNSDAYTLDAEGKIVKLNGKELAGGGGGGSTQIENVTVGSSSNPWTLNTAGSTDPLYDPEFPYYSIITQPGISEYTFAQIAYSNEQSTSMAYAPTCQTGVNKIYVFARADMGEQVIPTISIGMDYTDLTMQPIASDVAERTLTLISSSDAEVTGYPYKYSFPCSGATSQSTADVTFGASDANSGNFAPVCDTGTGVIYIWAKAAVSGGTCMAGYQLYYSNTATAISTANAGDDTHPVKIVNGEAVAVTNDLATLNFVAENGPRLFRATIPDNQKLSSSWGIKVLNLSSRDSSYDTTTFDFSTTYITLKRKGFYILTSSIAFRNGTTGDEMILGIRHQNSSGTTITTTNSRIQSGGMYDFGGVNSTIVFANANDRIQLYINGTSTNAYTSFSPDEGNLNILYVGNAGGQ